MFQSILPTEKRVQVFQYLYGQPIQMTVYGHAISYGTIGIKIHYDNIELHELMFRYGGCWNPGSFCFQDSSPGDECFVNSTYT